MAASAPSPVLHRTLVRVNARAWGLATGVLAGLALFTATNVLVIKGGEDVGSHLGRLANVLPGYSVSFAGSLVGFVYAFVIGYALGRFLCPRRPMEVRARPAHGRHVRIQGNQWGLATGSLLAACLFAITNVLLLRGGPDAGALLGHLSTWFPGFRMSFEGSLAGAAWMFALGYGVGRLTGLVYNRLVERAES